MSKYVNYDVNTGEFRGFYDDTLHASIPDPNLPISDSEWNDHISGISLKQVDVNTLTIIDQPLLDLEEFQLMANRKIDRTAETTRSRFVTVGSGQAMVYLEKADEAADYVVAGYPDDLSNYPFIQAEITATGKTKEQAADDILSQKSAWITIGAMIEQYRMAGKTQINTATSSDEIDSIVNDTIALLEAL